MLGDKTIFCIYLSTWHRTFAYTNPLANHYRMIISDGLADSRKEMGGVHLCFPPALGTLLPFPWTVLYLDQVLSAMRSESCSFLNIPVIITGFELSLHVRAHHQHSPNLGIWVRNCNFPPGLLWWSHPGIFSGGSGLTPGHSSSWPTLGGYYLYRSL